MRRRALLASAASLSLASLSGCLSDARRAVSGAVLPDHGHSELHPSDERVVRVPFPDDADVRGWVFADPPDDQTAVFTDRAMQGAYSNDLLWAEGDSFVLLFEVRMPPEAAAFYNVGRPTRWTGWDAAEIPIRRSPTDPERHRDAETLVCTNLSKFDVERGGAPSRVTLSVRDRETDEFRGSHRLGRWRDR